jgi:chemotaxis protein CheD
MSSELIIDYLGTGELPGPARDIVDVCSHKVVSCPTTGRVVVKKLRSYHNDSILQRGLSDMSHLRNSRLERDVALFSDT